MTLDLDTLCSHLDVARAANDVYGTDLASARGILHASAVWRSPDGGLFNLNINVDTPPSRHDRFVLNLARARADVIITTGKVLREEPSVTPTLIGSPEEVAPLVEWRRLSLDLEELPMALVLTSGRSLDLDHPFFHSPVPVTVFTGKEAASGIIPEALERSIDVVGHAAPSIAAAVEFVRQELGCTTVAIEAGPSTSLQLYRPALMVDELLLSQFLGPVLPQSVQGIPFLDSVAIEAAFPVSSKPYLVDEPSGPWLFRRWTRRPVA